jgi:hypothetical protein
MTPKFNASIQFELILGWFKYVDIKLLDNNRSKNLTFFHIICPKNIFDACSVKF